jgi:hypothetical protein
MSCHSNRSELTLVTLRGQRRLSGMNVRIARAFLALVSLLFPFSVPSYTATSDLEPELVSLAYFVGDWECSGKFDTSGKSIDAHEHFAVELEGAWITFRHDDKPPFNYHALSEWGWDKEQKKFVMVAQDSTGGVRVFYSAGWDRTQLLWQGKALGNTSPAGERFSFERIDDHHFKVSYYFLKNGSWSRVDSSACAKS